MKMSACPIPRKAVPALMVGVLLALPIGAQGGHEEQPVLADLLLADELTREQMTELYRTLAAGQFEPPACVAGQERFTDVPATSPFCPWIEELARRGITSGCTGTEYCPGNAVGRAQMAAFIVKALDLNIRDLAAWEHGNGLGGNQTVPANGCVNYIGGPAPPEARANDTLLIRHSSSAVSLLPPPGIEVRARLVNVDGILSIRWSVCNLTASPLTGPPPGYGARIVGVRE